MCELFIVITKIIPMENSDGLSLGSFDIKKIKFDFVDFNDG